MKKGIKACLENTRLSFERMEFPVKDIESFSALKSSYTAHDAVERRLAIIGEAMWQINKIDSTVEFTDKTKIIGLQHIFTHDYDLAGGEIIWKILQNNISLLKEETNNYFK